MKLTNDEIRYINAFGMITNVTPKGCIVGKNSIKFMVDPKDISKVIGKNGVTIKKVSQQFGTKIEVLPYAKTAEEYLKRSFFKIKFESVKKIEEDGKKFLEIELDDNNRDLLNANNSLMRKTKEILNKSYGVNGIKFKEK